jgi:hemerythrin-like metal-binding protein
MLIEWTDSLSVKIAEIDMQHKKLVSLLNGLHEATQDGRRAVPLAPLFGELLAYAAVHFETEERLMEKYRFPDLPAHRSEHERFVRQVVGFKELQEFEFYSQILSLDLLTFLKNWLQNHILKTDMLYGPYLNARGVN